MFSEPDECLWLVKPGHWCSIFRFLFQCHLPWLHSLLTRWLLQKLSPMAGDLRFDHPKVNSVTSLMFCGLLPSVVTPDAPVKSSNSRETLSSIHASVETKEHSPAVWVSCSISLSQSITKVFFLFVGLIFSASDSELYSEDLSSSETLVYLSLNQKVHLH